MVSLHVSKSITLTLITISILVLGFEAQARSIIWTDTSSTRICSPDWGPGANTTATRYIDRYGGPCTATRLWSRNVSIQYRIAVVNETRGVPVTCGGTVVKGDTISLKFVPHRYTDISWSGVGFSNDTPYGDWIASAGPPSGSPHQCLPKDQVNYKIYAPLSVAPPTKSISGQAGLGCGTLGSNGVMKCTPSTATESTVTFTFGATMGRFYGRSTTTDIPGAPLACVGSNSPMQTYTVGGTDCSQHISSSREFRACQFARPTGSVYTLSVPTRSISCKISVIEPNPNNQAPTAPVVSAPTCVAGVPHPLSIRATDPENDKVRYHIDWNGDGVTDQLLPANTFVASGAAQSATRTFATAGFKEIRARAEDEFGALSAWKTTTFECVSPSASAELDAPPLNLPDGASSPPSTNDLSLRAIPSLVRVGATTQVHWSSQNMVSCSVNGNNGDAWAGLNSPVDGAISTVIEGLVTYTLLCEDRTGATHSKSADVRVLPTWKER